MNSILNCVQNLACRMLSASNPSKEMVRFASKKARTSTQNVHTKVRPKHRGWKTSEQQRVTQGSLLATQRTLRFHPGLNVGVGRNFTLYALAPGRVYVTCEPIEPEFRRRIVQLTYGGRQHQLIYKKHFNVVCDSQHTNFKLVDQI